MKIRVFAVAALAAASSLIAFAPAQASGVCYYVLVNVNGEDVVNQTGCQDLP